MEIEAKFIVPNARIANKLTSLSDIGGFTLASVEALTLRDTFFDSRAHQLMVARYVLRVRHRTDGKTFITVKTPAIREGAIHRRPETEATVNWERTPRILPSKTLPKPIRNLIEPLVGETDLVSMFSITQMRRVRPVHYGRRIIAEWSVDRVEFKSGGRHKMFYELEVELKKTGTEQDLTLMVGDLMNNLSLQPQLTGKFQRALEFMREHNNQIPERY